MGSWGDRPDENDAAQDYLSTYVIEPVQKSVGKLMRKRIGRSDPSHEKWARIGVIYAMAKGEVPVGARWIEQALDWLDEIADDEDWIQSWRDPTAIKRSIANTRNLFERRLDPRSAYLP